LQELVKQDGASALLAAEDYSVLGRFIKFESCTRVQAKSKTPSRQPRWKVPFTCGVEVFIDATPNARAGRCKPRVSRAVRAFDAVSL